jgi:hypothetical protein
MPNSLKTPIKLENTNIIGNMEITKNPGKRHTHKRTDMIEKIVDLKLNHGYSNHNLLKHLKEVEGLSQPYAYELIRNAKQEIDYLSVRAFKDDKTEVIQHFETIYQKAIAENNLFVAKDCLKEVSRIKGMYVDKVEVQHSGGLTININLPDDEL